MKRTSKIIVSTLLIIAFVMMAVGFAAVPLQSIKLNSGNILLKVNRTYALKATLTPSNTTQKSLVYSTSNSKVATVDKNGVIKGINAGKASIIVKSTSNSKITAKCNVTVTAVKKINLRYWVFNPANQYFTTMNENAVFAEMEKLTGIHMSFTHPSQTALNEQFNLMIASNDLPDIIGIYGGGTFFQQGLDKAVDDKIILNLTPHLKDYAPNYKKLLDTNKVAYRQIATNTSKIASFNMIQVNDDPVWYCPNINKTWMDELNIQTPVTIDDWYNMLKAFKTIKKAEAPLLTIGANGIDGFGIFIGAYGIRNSYFVAKDKKSVKYGPYEPQFKDYLVTMNKWYKEGLIDKDFPTLTGAQMTSKWSTQKAGSILHAVEIFYPLAVANKFDMAVAPYPVLKKGDRYTLLNDLNGVQSETVITTANKYVAETMKWFDYAYSDKGSMLFNYGVEGSSYTMVDGKPKWTDLVMKNPKYPMPSPIYIFKLHAFPQKYYGSDSSPHVNETTLNLRKVTMNNADISQTLPATKILSEDGKMYSQIMSQVQTYQNEMVLKFILGEESIDKFAQYIDQLKKLGIEDAIKMQQKAYDLYMKK